MVKGDGKTTNSSNSLKLDQKKKSEKYNSWVPIEAKITFTNAITSEIYKNI